jgi:glycosyltransferase involved in cell wall biosynthesis
MKVLWITNTLFPDACALIGIKPQVVGGWMFSSAQDLLKRHQNIEFAVATTYNGTTFHDRSINRIRYFLIPLKNKLSYSKKLERDWKDVKALFDPDIVHIHGTEYPVGLAYINGCGNANVIISIQGLVSVIYRYYLAGMSTTEVLFNITFRDLLKRDTLLHQRKKVKERGNYERKLLISAKNIIGRTSWDRSHTFAINPNARYFFCNETLRSDFYHNCWSLKNCERHRIFISQAQYPLKGFHQLLKALPLLREKYLDIKVYIAGSDSLKSDFLGLKTYNKYLRSLVRKGGLEDIIVFTGELSEGKMIEAYLKSHIFICPSSIENSSNSVGEAQLVGVPVIASYVGGMSDMIVDNQTGLLYRFEEFEMLASLIDQLFKDDALALKLSYNGREQAMIRHDRETNINHLFFAYEELKTN